MDLASGYWQIKMKEEDKPKDCICDQKGAFPIQSDAVWPVKRSCHIPEIDGESFDGVTVAEVFGLSGRHHCVRKNV